MNLMQMLEEALNGHDATSTVAIKSTYKLKTSLNVATVATVAVANPNEQTIENTQEWIGNVGKAQIAQIHNPQSVRLRLFQSKGVSGQEASDIVQLLNQRDKELDDRRSCAECMCFFADKCQKRINPIGETTVQTLHRCIGFELNITEQRSP